MKKTTLFLLAPFLFIIFYCSNSIKKERFVNEKKLNNVLLKELLFLKNTGKKTFLLDSLTSSHLGIMHLRFQKLENKKVITFLNFSMSNLYIYDYETNKLLKSIDVVSPEKNIEKGFVFDMYIKSLDSIFILTDASRSIYLINQKREILKSYKKGNFKNNASFETSDSILVSINSDFKVFDKYLYTHTSNGYDIKKYMGNQSVMIRFDIMTGERETFNISYPKKYQNMYFGADFGSLFSSFYHSTHNKNTNSMIYSFPADNNIYFIDVQKKIMKEYVAKSKYIDDILPLTDEEARAYRKFPTDTYINLRGMYFGMIYDQYNDLYYRPVILPVKNRQNAEKMRFFQSKNSIVILNNKFEKIGETLLPDTFKYNFMNAICTQEGLLLPRITGDNEDLLVFDIFQPTKK